jgi:hypothetical protein
MLGILNIVPKLAAQYFAHLPGNFAQSPENLNHERAKLIKRHEKILYGAEKKLFLCPFTFVMLVFLNLSQN